MCAWTCDTLGMLRLRLACLTVWVYAAVAVACSDAGSPPANGNERADASDEGSDAGAANVEAGAAANSKDAAPSSKDDDALPLPWDAGVGAMPPAGSTLCGQGAFAMSQSTALCQTAQFEPQGNRSYSKQCGAVAFTHGAWEAWCSPGSRYLFARFDGLGDFGVAPAYAEYRSGTKGGSAATIPSSDLSTIFVHATVTLGPGSPPTEGTLFLMRSIGSAFPTLELGVLGAVSLSWK